MFRIVGRRHVGQANSIQHEESNNSIKAYGITTLILFLLHTTNTLEAQCHSSSIPSSPSLEFFGTVLSHKDDYFRQILRKSIIFC
mmetsp:Transcript_9837/g.13922  ORF Transcript_9837/g.13922 Transcript_9837/m.13922 type:complete len:85 (-) Transcript_9837:199-453(-)